MNPTIKLPIGIVNFEEIRTDGYKFPATKEWHDGYRFGNADVCCLWDVINYCAKLRANPKALPRAF